MTTAYNNVERRRLKYAATINDDVLSEETGADYELQYVDIGNVDSLGKIHEIATYPFAEAPSRARRRVRDGDVIISCVRTYLQAIAAVQDPPDNLIVSTGFAVVRPCSGVLDAAFGRYVLREPSFLAEVEMRSVGVSYPAVNATDLGDIPVHLPPEPNQRMLDALVNRQDRDVTGAGKATVIVDLLQTADHLRIAIAIHPDTLGEVRTRQRQVLLGNGRGIVVQEVVGFGAEVVGNLIDPQHWACYRHDGTLGLFGRLSHNYNNKSRDSPQGHPHRIQGR